MAEYTARVTRVVDHGRETRSLFLARPAGLSFAPGQFLSFRLSIDGVAVTKPYTFASPPEDAAEIELLFNRVPGGVASSHLFGVDAGAELTFTAPWGTFVLERAPAAECVLIAEDTGIAAIRPMAHRAATTATHPVHLLYATEHPLFVDELRALPGIALRIVPRAALQSEVAACWIDADGDRTRHFYVCGIGQPVLAIRDALRGAGYVRRAVQYEKW